MRALFVSWPWRTHFQPLVPLAWALQAAGHEVQVASGPELADVMTSSGLTSVVVGTEERVLEGLAERFTEEQVAMVRTLEELGPRDDLLFDFAETREEELTWDRLRLLTRYLTEIHKGMNEALVEELVEYCQWWKPDLVVWDWLSQAGSIAAAAVGAASARVRSEIDWDARFRRNFVRVRAQQPPEGREDALADWLGGWAQKYGGSFSEEMVTGDFTIDHMLDSMRLETQVPHVPVRYVSYHGPSVVSHWTRRDPAKRRVLATFGVSQNRGREYQAATVQQLQDMLDSLADLDIELIVTLPRSIQADLKRIPGNTTLVEFVPLHVIIPSCSAVIHHGGIPGFMEAIEHHVPQLLVGRIPGDIEERAPLLEEARAGLHLPPRQLRGERVRECLVRLLEDPEFKEGTGRLRKELAGRPTPSEVIRDLEILTDRYRRR
ncbi:nucleotide disphospho-sugar-binding domain-containing protein [Streptomyces sp. NPDC059649]|uniref:nucleotide disphospho-sugar-binding domain-containing protein n=1 Tax=Streptomyces sp. NPDC059649 TaxID=3346895 RepID=UPI0036CD5B67